MNELRASFHDSPSRIFPKYKREVFLLCHWDVLRSGYSLTLLSVQWQYRNFGPQPAMWRAQWRYHFGFRRIDIMEWCANWIELVHILVLVLDCRGVDLSVVCQDIAVSFPSLFVRMHSLDELIDSRLVNFCGRYLGIFFQQRLTGLVVITLVQVHFRSRVEYPLSWIGDVKSIL